MTVLSEQDKIRLLADIVKIQTENDHEIEVCEYLKDLLSQYDIDSKIVKVNDSRANLVAEIGSGAPVLAISGHMDVVMLVTMMIGLFLHLNSQIRMASYSAEVPLT